MAQRWNACTCSSCEVLAGSICQLRHLSQTEHLASTVLLSVVKLALALFPELASQKEQLAASCFSQADHSLRFSPFRAPVSLSATTFSK